MVLHAQGPGGGISKDTRACSEGIIDGVWEFMMKYFPVSEADNDCLDRQCTCGVQARAKLIARAEDINFTGHSLSDDSDYNFGLHCVYAAGEYGERVKMAGTLSQLDLEAIICNKLGHMTTYDVFMEYNSALWTSNITEFVLPLEANGEEYYALKWDDKISIFVHPPLSTIVLEVVGYQSTAPYLILRHAETSDKRFTFRWLDGSTKAPLVAPGVMAALWVSRASTNLDRDEKWFKDIFEIGPEHFTRIRGKDANGNLVEIMEIQMAEIAYTKYRLVQPINVTNGTYSVHWWENYQNNVHNQYMTSPTCGWDLLGDNHNGFDWVDNDFDTGTIVKNLAEAGYPYFCKNKGNGEITCFLCTPFGYQIQTDGQYEDPPIYYTYSDEDLCASYEEFCYYELSWGNTTLVIIIVILVYCPFSKIVVN